MRVQQLKVLAEHLLAITARTVITAITARTARLLLITLHALSQPRGVRASELLAALVDLEVRVLEQRLEPLVRQSAALLQPRRQLRVHLRLLAVQRDAPLLPLLVLLAVLLLLVLLVHARLRHHLRALVQLVVHEVPVHVRPQRLRADQVLQAQLAQLRARHLRSTSPHAPHEFVVLVHAALLLLQLLRQVVQERAPPRRRAQRGDEVRQHLRLLRRHQHQSAVSHHVHVVHVRLGLQVAQALARLGVTPSLCTCLQVADLHRLLVGRQQVIAAEFNAGDRRLVDVFQLHEWLAVADVEQLHHACRAAHRQLHAIIAEPQVTRLCVEDLHALKAFTRARVVALNLAVDVSHRQHLMHRSQNHLIQLRAVCGDGSHERALLQVQTVDLVAVSHCKQFTAFLYHDLMYKMEYTVIGHVTAKLGNARSVVETVASMELQRAVCKEEGEFAEIIRQELELHNLAV